MSMTKRWIEQRQEEFAKDRFMADGCPEDEASKMTWEDAVEHLFDGDEEGTWDYFVAWCGED